MLLEHLSSTYNIENLLQYDHNKLPMLNLNQYNIKVNRYLTHFYTENFDTQVGLISKV